MAGRHVCHGTEATPAMTAPHAGATAVARWSPGSLLMQLAGALVAGILLLIVSVRGPASSSSACCSPPARSTSSGSSLPRPKKHRPPPVPAARWASRLALAKPRQSRAHPPRPAVGLALAASWFSMWGLYAAYTWTASAFGSTLQFSRFYVPAIGAISLLGSWPVTSAAVAMFGLGAWPFATMRDFPLGAFTRAAWHDTADGVGQAPSRERTRRRAVPDRHRWNDRQNYRSGVARTQISGDGCASGVKCRVAGRAGR